MTGALIFKPRLGVENSRALYFPPEAEAVLNSRRTMNVALPRIGTPFAESTEYRFGDFYRSSETMESITIGGPIKHKRKTAAERRIVYEKNDGFSPSLKIRSDQENRYDLQLKTVDGLEEFTNSCRKHHYSPADALTKLNELLENNGLITKTHSDKVKEAVIACCVYRARSIFSKSSAEEKKALIIKLDNKKELSPLITEDIDQVFENVIGSYQDEAKAEVLKWLTILSSIESWQKLKN